MAGWLLLWIKLADKPPVLAIFLAAAVFLVFAIVGVLELGAR